MQVQCNLSDEQRTAVERLLSSDSRVQTLGGYAGTGKTTLIRTLKDQLPRFAVCAYTGKAANVLRRKGVAGACTIHSMIFSPREEAWYDRECVHIKVVYDLKEPSEVEVDGFIVDEASMVGRELHDALLTFGLPLIYVGDHGQLPPVGGHDFNLMSKPDITLETVHRNAGEIARFADHIRRGHCAWDWPEHSGCTGERVQLCTIEQMMAEVGKTMPDQIICAYNATRVGINRDLRESIGYPPDRPIVGDRVMCLQNSRQLGVFNGMQGTVKGLVGDVMLFHADGKDYRVRFDPARFNQERTPEGYRGQGRLPFDYCYAVTAHKAQGDEWDNVLVLEQRCRHWDHARWAYTAASRARHRLMWVAM